MCYVAFFLLSLWAAFSRSALWVLKCRFVVRMGEFPCMNFVLVCFPRFMYVMQGRCVDIALGMVYVSLSES